MDDLTAPRIERPTDSGSLRRYPTPRAPKAQPVRSAPPSPDDQEKPADSDDHQLDVTA